MASLSLREAGDATGVSKSTIFRAIKAGRLSASRTDDGNFAIDPAELFRVYPPKGDRDVAARPETRPPGQSASADATEIRIRNAELEAQLNALRQILENERERAAELKAERDKWQTQAAQLLLQGPPMAVVTPAPARASTVPHVVPRGWWPFRRSA
jgi:hypothetical protein